MLLAHVPEGVKKTVNICNTKAITSVMHSIKRNAVSDIVNLHSELYFAAYLR